MLPEIVCPTIDNDVTNANTEDSTPEGQIFAIRIIMGIPTNCWACQNYQN
jgi:hypothetical protein